MSLSGKTVFYSRLDSFEEKIVLCHEKESGQNHVHSFGKRRWRARDDDLYHGLVGGSFRGN